MAYVFNKLQNMLGEDQKQNIFQGQPQESYQGPKQSSFKLTGGGESAGAPAVKDSGSPEDHGGMNLVSGAETQQIAAKNKPAGQGDVFGDIASGIQQKEQQLSAEAKNYEQSAEKQRSGYYGLSPDALQQKLEQDIKGGKTEDIYGFTRGTNRPEQIKAFETGVTTGDINVPKNQQELATYLTGKGGQTYSKGMGRLDAALLGKSQAYQAEQAKLQAQKEALNAQREKALGLTAGEQKQSADEYAATQAAIQDALTKMQSNLLESQKSDKEKYANMLKQGPTDAERQAAIDEALKGITGKRPDVDINEALKFVDPSKYYSSSLTGDTEDLTGYLDEGERSYYNQLADLLGTQPKIGSQVGYQSGYDIDALRSAIQNEYNKQTSPLAPYNPSAPITDRGGYLPADQAEVQRQMVENPQDLMTKTLGKKTKETGSKGYKKLLEQLTPKPIKFF